MRIAVISDVHGNLEALIQVLADIDKCGVDAIICLGDNIGYGPDPEKVIHTIRDRDIPSVMGNHELAVSDHLQLDWFNPLARQSLERTLDILSKENDALDYVHSLQSSIVKYECRFVHGFPPNSATTYLFQVPIEVLHTALTNQTERICFVGHTHDLEIIGFNGKNISSDILDRGKIKLHNDLRYIINTGSVGQPRDGNNSAKYVIWDAESNELEVRFVSYDVDAVVAKIMKAGLPKAHANRLR